MFVMLHYNVLYVKTGANENGILVFARVRFYTISAGVPPGVLMVYKRTFPKTKNTVPISTGVIRYRRFSREKSRKQYCAPPP